MREEVHTLVLKNDWLINKAEYTATQVACGWAGEVMKAGREIGQEQKEQGQILSYPSRVWGNEGSEEVEKGHWGI